MVLQFYCIHGFFGFFLFFIPFLALCIDFFISSNEYSDISVLFFSPQPSTNIDTFTTAEFAIYCIPSTVDLLIAKLRTFVHESSLFVPEYLKIKHPRKYIVSSFFVIREL